MLAFIIIIRNYWHIVIIMNRHLLHKKVSKLYEVQQHFEQRLLHAKNLFNSNLNDLYDEDNFANVSLNLSVKLHN